jgi:hypothetical protein
MATPLGLPDLLALVLAFFTALSFRGPAPADIDPITPSR